MLMWMDVKAVALLSFVLLCGLWSRTAAEYYSFDGRGNNHDHPEWGSANTPFVRKQVRTISYGDGISSLAGATRPSAREITMKLQPRGGRPQPRNTRRLTDMVTYLGQFFDHEFDLRAESDEESAEIPVPLCDAKWDRDCHGNATIRFHRSGYVKNAAGPRQQINTVTAFLDGSVVYGSSEERAQKLRTHVKGRMATSGGLLPDNVLQIAMGGKARDGKLKAAGDVRANVHPPMLALQTLFVREHNRLAAQFHAENPIWSDEHIFQEARKFIVAYLQSICFHEYLPMLGIALDPYDGYKADVDPSIDNFFAAVSYRYGHSEVNEILLRVDEEGWEIPDGHLPLSRTFFAPQTTLNNGIEPILRGLCMKLQAEVDTYFASSIMHYMFGTPKKGAVDLIATDIQRGRDHGIPDYNTARIELGLPEVSSFEEITSDPFTRRILQELYGDVNNVDAYVGGMAEDHVDETNLGPLFYTSLKDQYQRIRDGDRLYYENTANGLFSEEQITDIKSTGLRDIILRNTDIQFLPDNIYLIENEQMPWPKGMPESLTDSKADTLPATSAETTLVLTEDYAMTYWLEEDIVHFRLRGDTEGWMAIGFEGPSGGMVDADIIICSVQNNQAEVRDAWSTTFAEPGADDASGGTNDITIHDFSETDGTTEVHFSRALDTGDALDRTINKDQETKIIFAWGASDTLAYHGVSNRGKNTILVTMPVQAEEGTDSDDSSAVGGSLSLANGDYELSWELVPGSSSGSRRRLAQAVDRVLFSLVLNGEGWVGLGIAGSAGGMTGADIVVAQTNAAGECEVADYWSESFAEPTKDVDLGGTDDLEDISCSKENGKTRVSFSKPITSADANDNTFDAEAGIPIIFAFDLASGTLAYHAANRGSAMLEASVDTTAAEDGSPSTSSELDDNALEFAQSKLGAFTLLWAVSGDELIVKMQTDSDVWVGIGLEPEDGGMVAADMYIGFKDTDMRVADCWSSGYGQPAEDSAADGENSLLDSGGSFENGVYEYWFKRKLDTGDSRDKVIEDKTIDLVYAWGSSSSLAYHGPSQRALASINFASSEGVVSVMDLSRTMIRAHGGIMVVAWAVLGLVGSGVARFGRGWSYWLKAHRLIQISTTVLALIGEVIGFSYTKGSFRTAHSITALCVVFVTFPQVSLGAAAMKKSGNVHYSKLHKGTGYFLIGLATWQIWTGLLTLEIGNQLRRVFVAWIAAWFLAFHFSSMKATTRETESLFKYAVANGESTNGGKSRRQSRAESSRVEKEEAPEPRKSIISRKSSMASQLGRSARGSEMIELLIKGDSTDDSDADSDVSSMGATNWSESVAGGQLGNESGVTSDQFFMSIQEGSLWTIINDVVYDLTDYIAEHPGGVKVMEDIVGMDGTDSFLEAHGDDRTVMRVLAGLTVGELNDEDGILDTEGTGSFLPMDMNVDVSSATPNPAGQRSRASSISSQRSEQNLTRTQSLISFEVGLSRREWRSFVIENVDYISSDVLLFRIHIPGDQAVEFPITSHLMVRGVDPATGKNVTRCFTPLVPDQSIHRNKLDILVKCYEDGRMSRHMRTLQAGSQMEIKGPLTGLKVEKGAWQRIGLIGGGSGITPLWQVLDGMLSDPDDTTQICLLYQNRYEEDILLRSQLDAWVEARPSRFRIVYILSKPPEGWTGASGRLDAALLEKHLPRADVPGSFIMVCGPPGLNKSVAGEVDSETDERTDGLLHHLGYTNDTIHVFQ